MCSSNSSNSFGSFEAERTPYPRDSRVHRRPTRAGRSV
ncbi:hypothetical protein BUC_0280 [Burkholderia pseudomallei 576]|nr:hypothetical protein BUC_0280 [Burkholderia pseudomallei 576]